MTSTPGARGGGNFDGSASRDTWRSFKDGKGLGPGTLFKMAAQAGWTGTRRELMTPAERADLARRLLQAKADRQQAQQAAWAAEAPSLTRLWAACRSVQADGNGNDPVTLYLRHRLVLAAGDHLDVP